MSSLQLAKGKSLIQQSINLDVMNGVCLYNADFVSHKNSHIGRTFTHYNQYYSGNNTQCASKKPAETA